MTRAFAPLVMTNVSSVKVSRTCIIGKFVERRENEGRDHDL